MRCFLGLLFCLCASLGLSAAIKGHGRPTPQRNRNSGVIKSISKNKNATPATQSETCKHIRGSRQNLNRPAVKKLPDAKGSLHLYALPVGQGNGLVLQCPNGDISIIDLGTKNSINRGFWWTKEIRDFLQIPNDSIKNIVITHNDEDHYCFFSEVFTSPGDLRGLNNIYISRKPEDMPSILTNWINNIGANNKLRVFNGGETCGTSNINQRCESIDLCPGLPKIETVVLSANAGDCEHSKKANVDSIVIEITFGEFAMQLNGDFEDCVQNQKNGPLTKMADYYKSKDLTVYMLSHHGADSCANKRVLLDAVKPKAVFVSSDPWFRSDWRHPKCSITDYLIQKRYLCKPGETDPSNRFYCDQHPRNDLNLNDKLQQRFTCGTSNGYKQEPRNEFAIYSTTPTENEMNLVHLVTDGDKWGFINDIQPRFV